MKGNGVVGRCTTPHQAHRKALSSFARAALLVCLVCQVAVQCAAATQLTCNGSPLSSDEGGSAISGTYNVKANLTCSQQAIFNLPSGSDVTIHVNAADPIIIGALRFKVEEGSNLTFTGSNFTIAGNEGGELYGGGLANLGKVIFSQKVTFDNNKAAWAGAIYNAGHLTCLQACAFTDNEATSNTSWGGAIQNDHGTIIFEDVATFSGNEAAAGGAIDNSGTVTFVGVATFENNSASETFGGGFSNFGDMTFETECSFSGNNALYGGAFSNDGSLFFLSTATFEENTAEEGGGVYSDGSIHFSNDLTVFLSNTATAYGGALYGYSGVAYFGDVYFYGNNISSGGNSSNGNAVYLEAYSHAVFNTSVYLPAGSSANVENDFVGIDVSTIAFDSSASLPSDADICTAWNVTEMEAELARMQADIDEYYNTCGTLASTPAPTKG